jgi:ferredoxin
VSRLHLNRPELAELSPRELISSTQRAAWAHRSGAGCTAGKGECPACVVSVKAGADLLSAPSSLEENQLGVEQLDQSLRLACQVKIENHGDVVVMVRRVRKIAYARQQRIRTCEEVRRFAALKKLATLVQLEAITMSEAFDSAIEKPLAFGSKTFDAIANRAARTKQESKKK